MSSMTKYIQGTLIPKNLNKMGGHTRDSILNAAVNNDLGLIIKDLKADWTIAMNSQSLAMGTSSTVYGFLPALSSFLDSEEAKEMDFEGNIMVTVITNAEPVVIRIEVREGAVNAERASFAWSSHLEA